MNWALQTCRKHPALVSKAEVEQAGLVGWDYSQFTLLSKSFTFNSHPELMLFLQAVAWIAHQQDHHPLVSYAYHRCTLSFTTDSLGKLLSTNDVICAAKIDALGLL